MFWTIVAVVLAVTLILTVGLPSGFSLGRSGLRAYWSLRRRRD